MGEKNNEEEGLQPESSFGRRGSDQIGIVHLYQSMEKLRQSLQKDIRGVKDDVGALQSTVNNGVKRQVKVNTKCIETLTDEFDLLQKIIKEQKGYRQGKIKAWQVIIAVISSLGGGVVGTLTALSLLGVL